MTFGVGRHVDFDIGKLARLSDSHCRARTIVSGAILVVSIMMFFIAMKKAVVSDES